MGSPHHPPSTPAPADCPCDFPGSPWPFSLILTLLFHLCVRVRACGSQGQPQVLSSSAVRSRPLPCLGLTCEPGGLVSPKTTPPPQPRCLCLPSVLIMSSSMTGFGFLCMFACLYACVPDVCLAPCRFWEWNSAPLKEQPLLLTAEPSLQPCFC